MSSASETESALSREKLLRGSSESYRDVVVVRGISRGIRVALGISAAVNVLLCCALVWLWSRPVADPSLGRQWCKW